MVKRNLFSKIPEEERRILEEIGADLRQVILYPFLILFKIPANLLSVFYKGVCLYSSKIPQCAGRILLLPVNLMIGVGEILSLGQVRDGMRRGEEGIKTRICKYMEKRRTRRELRRDTRSKLKIYERTVACIASPGAVAVNSYFGERCCYFFAFLLQTVSFFTTYAGIQLYFGGVFFLAPFLITLVVQGTLYIAVVTVFKPGRRRWPMAACLAIFAFASILFSYTGLITLYNSPEKDYMQAYESYEEQFTQAKRSILEGYSPAGQAVTKVMKAVEAMRINDAMAVNEIRVLTEQKAAIEIPPQFTNSKSVAVAFDGTRTTTTSAVANAGYQEAVAKMDRINLRIARLETYRQPVAGFLEEFDEAAIRNALEEGPDGGKGDEESNGTAGRLETSFSSAAASNTLAGELGTGSLIDSNLVTDCRAKTREYRQVQAVTLAVPNTGGKEKEKQLSGIMNMIMKAGALVGADFGNANMNQLTDTRSQVQTAVNENYGKLAFYGRKGRDLGALAEAKAQVDSLPGIMVFAVQRLSSPSTRPDAVLCLVLALFNDGTSILLGFAGSCRRGSLLSRRKGVRDVDQLFDLLYQSIQGAFSAQIQGGRFDHMTDEEFKCVCRNYVGAVSARLYEFTGRFGISPCTSAEGYNRCWIYKNEKEVIEFAPLISALMQAGILKIMPLSQYREIERRFVRGVSDDTRRLEREGKEYVLLLRNSGEEYMTRQFGQRLMDEEAMVPYLAKG